MSDRLHSILSILEVNAATSVRLGKLWIPAKQLETSLSRYSHALICVSEEIVSYPYAFRGSSTALRFSNKSFLYCCRHQLDGMDFRNICISPKYDFSQNLVSGSAFISVNVPQHDQTEAFEDVYCFAYNTKQYGISNFEKEFFEVEEKDIWPKNTTNFLMTFGFPTSEKEFGMDEAEEKLTRMHFRQHVIKANYSESFKTSNKYYHKADLLKSTIFDFDGMSGAPVFHLGKDELGYFIGLAGIITRGGR